MVNWAHPYAAMLLLVQLTACSEDAPTADPARAPQAVTSAPEASTPAADTRLVLIFGDSLFAGYGLDQDEGLAPALERALGSQGIKARVVNGGVSGDTSAAGLQRLAFTLDGLERAPDLVVVGLGANDMLRGLSPDQTRANLDAILTELSRRKIEVMLTGMLAAPNLGADYAAAFNPIYPELAKKHGAALYPFLLEGVIGNRDRLLADGIHPNAGGVARIAAQISPIVAKELGD